MSPARDALLWALRLIEDSGWDGEATTTASCPPTVPPSPMVQTIDIRLVLRKEQGK